MTLRAGFSRRLSGWTIDDLEGNHPFLVSIISGLFLSDCKQREGLVSIISVIETLSAPDAGFETPKIRQSKTRSGGMPGHSPQSERGLGKIAMSDERR